MLSLPGAFRRSSGGSIRDSRQVSGRSLSIQIVLHRPHGDLGTRMQVELGEDMIDVIGCRLLGDRKRGRDLTITEAAGDKYRHLSFPR